MISFMTDIALPVDVPVDGIGYGACCDIDNLAGLIGLD